MRLARAEIENFQKITVIDITFNDRVTEISGKNGAGKSSVFAALHACLDQLSMPADPIRHGADTAAIRTHLKGDDDSILLVTKRIREDAKGKVVTDLALETPDGARYPQAATHLKKIISDHLLDPLEILDMKPDEQLEVLKSLVPGFDFAANQRFIDGFYANRTEVNKDQKREKAAADSIIVPADTPEVESDVVELSAELEAAVAHNSDCATRKTNRENATNRIKELRDSADLDVRTIESDAAFLTSKEVETITELEAQIVTLKQKIERTREETKEALARGRHHYTEEATRKRGEADALEQKIAAAGEPKVPHTDEELAAKRKAIADAQVTNKKVAAAKTKKTHLANAAAHATQSAELTKKIDALEQEREDAITKANLPVTGLGFGAGCMTLNGAPFEQASKAEQMRTAFSLVLAKQSGDLRFCWISDAALLDDDNRALVDKLAEEFDVQVLLETVKPGSSNAIILEDGHVQGVELEPKLTAVSKPAVPAANESSDPAASTDAPAPRQRRRFQGPGAPTGGAA